LEEETHGIIEEKTKLDDAQKSKENVEPERMEINGVSQKTDEDLNIDHPDLSVQVNDSPGKVKTIAEKSKGGVQKEEEEEVNRSMDMSDMSDMSDVESDQDSLKTPLNRRPPPPPSGGRPKKKQVKKKTLPRRTSVNVTTAGKDIKGLVEAHLVAAVGIDGSAPTSPSPFQRTPSAVDKQRRSLAQHDHFASLKGMSPAERRHVLLSMGGTPQPSPSLSGSRRGSSIGMIRASSPPPTGVLS